MNETANAVTAHALAGQVAIVTGAGRGLGRVLAESLAAAGAAVAVAARTVAQIEETVAHIEGAGGRAITLPADVTDRAGTEWLVDETVRRLGPIDLLVNNAGVNEVFGPLWQVDPEAWRREFDVNFFGPVLCARAVLPGMVARGRGRIINVASQAGLAPRPYYAAYGCAKTALIRLTESLAIESATHGIAVFALHPGLLRTTMNEAKVLDEAFPPGSPGN